MKKIILICILSILVLSLASCDLIGGIIGGGSNTPTTPAEETKTYDNENRMVTLLKNYSTSDSNGFDYSVEQTYKESTVNAHTVSLRIDGENGKKGSRYECIKNLNETITDGLYTETSATSYYADEKVATYDGENWVWKDCTWTDFSALSFQKFSLEVNESLSAVAETELTNHADYSSLTYRFSDDKASEFLGVSGSVKNLFVEIQTDLSCEKLLSFTMSYSQKNTKTVFSFVPYRETVTIELPE